MKIDLGCGMRKKEGFTGMDVRPYKNVDYVVDAGKDKFPFEDNSVEEIWADNVFEHFNVDQLLHCLDECWRVLKSSGKLTVIVPKSGTGAWYAHPDHKMHFVEDSFAFYQVPLNGIDVHGYLNHFWFVGVKLIAPQMIEATFSPNKKNNPNYEYVQIRRVDGEILG